MSNVLSVLSSTAPYISGAVSMAVALGTFHWLNVRPRAKRLSVIDLATKRIAFWDQSLKLELLTLTGNPEQDEARARTFLAIRRIRQDANRELKRITESERLRREVGRRPLSLRWPSFLPKERRVDWVLLKVMAWFWLLEAVLYGAVLIVGFLMHSESARSGSKLHSSTYEWLLEGVLLISAVLLFATIADLVAERLILPQGLEGSVPDEI